MGNWELEDWIVWPIVLFVLFYVTTERFLDWSPLRTIEWDAVAAVATAVAVIVALNIATSEARERKIRATEATAVFSRMVMPDITAARLEFRNLRKFFRAQRNSVTDAMMTDALKQIGSKLTFRLTAPTLVAMRDQILCLNGKEALAYGQLLASVEQFRSNVALLGREKMGSGWSRRIFDALRAEVLSGQLLANISFDIAWKYSEKPSDPPRVDDFMFDDEEIEFLNKYHESGEFATVPTSVVR